MAEKRGRLGAEKGARLWDFSGRGEVGWIGSMNGRSDGGQRDDNVFTHYLSWLSLADVRVWWGSAEMIRL